MSWSKQHAKILAILLNSIPAMHTQLNQSVGLPFSLIFINGAILSLTLCKLTAPNIQFQMVCSWEVQDESNHAVCPEGQV